jgi:hypothetical protein
MLIVATLEDGWARASAQFIAVRGAAGSTEGLLAL